MKQFVTEGETADMSHLIDFDVIPWNEPTKGVRSKAIVKGNQQLRLVEFSYGFVEPD